jgi:hypothetical protein
MDLYENYFGIGRSADVLTIILQGLPMQTHSMRHRHINSVSYTLEAIDDIISRGKLIDWIELRDALAENPDLAASVRGVCRNYLHDKTEQRYHLWNDFACAATQRLTFPPTESVSSDNYAGENDES